MRGDLSLYRYPTTETSVGSINHECSLGVDFYFGGGELKVDKRLGFFVNIDA